MQKVFFKNFFKKILHQYWAWD